MSEERREQIRALRSASNREDEVRELIRKAGPRPAVSMEDLAQIRHAAKDQWRELVRRERERKRFQRRRDAVALAASVVLALLLGWWLLPGKKPAPSDFVATVELLRGEVRNGQGLELTSASRLAAGTVLETSSGGAVPSRAALRLPGGQSVRLDTDSAVRLVSGTVLEIDRGAVYVDTASAVVEGGIAISTPYGRVRDIGTQFEVRVGDDSGSELTVRIREGGILLEQDSESYSAKAGEELTVREGSVVRGRVEPHDQVWDWVLGVAPSLDIEGVNLSAYLDWVSRETGRRPRFADEALAESANTTRLHGTIEGLTPLESLAVVLPASGLDYRVENGSVVVTKPASSDPE
jgi:ferric-dicitrate binding protein FerR (iron transport regulator)